MVSLNLSDTSASPVEEQNLAWPVRTDENWRFGSWKNGNLSNLEKAEKGTPFSGEMPAELDNFSRFVFENAALVSGSHSAVELTKASCQPESKLGSEAAAQLHGQVSEHGLVVSATEDVQIEIIHVVAGRGLLAPSLTIKAADGANVTVLERFVSATESETSTVLAAVKVEVEAGSHVTYLTTQELSDESRLIRLADTKLQGQATATQAVIHTGASWVREETYSTVDGSDSKSEILSVAVPDSGQEYDQRTFQHHGARDTYSDLLFKNTLFGKAKTIFSGLIFVDEGAHGTDAYQTCRNLMMTDECEANSMPGLEINADGVKCSHGSTTSRVSEEEIFYLRARGIDAKSARFLVALGFSADALEKLGSEVLEKVAIEVVERKFRKVG